MKPTVVDVTGSHKLIDNLKLSGDDSGNDSINSKLLKIMKFPSSPFLRDIFYQSLSTGKIPPD